MARIDYDRVAARFEKGRGIALDGLAGWRDAIAPYINSGDRVLDLGSGTGMFAEAIARWFVVSVIGVEPSAGMRREANRVHAHPLVSYAGGDAEHLPLGEAKCDVAWLSTMIHHVGDLTACARDVARVLRPAGVVLIRSAFPDQPVDITTLNYFPTARQVLETFPTVGETEDAFRPAGFVTAGVASVSQVSAPSLRAYAERVRERTDTLLLGVPDDEFAAGLAALQRDANNEASPMPIVNRLSLLVLRRDS
jgi:ubiquinone/menaquinone biosynthesis C-methylase UbiE